MLQKLISIRFLALEEGAWNVSVQFAQLELRRRLRSAANAVSLPKPEPRAIRELIVVPPIYGREVACAERSGVRHGKDAL
jgi:hypothetical protein